MDGQHSYADVSIISDGGSDERDICPDEMLIPQYSRLCDATKIEFLNNAAVPPVSKATLSELDLNWIMHNVSLRVDQVDAYPVRRRKPLRATRACNSCRQRKAKCDEGRLECRHCRDNNLECVYRDASLHNYPPPPTGIAMQYGAATWHPPPSPYESPDVPDQYTNVPQPYLQPQREQSVYGQDPSYPPAGCISAPNRSPGDVPLQKQDKQAQAMIEKLNTMNDNIQRMLQIQEIQARILQFRESQAIMLQVQETRARILDISRNVLPPDRKPNDPSRQIPPVKEETGAGRQATPNQAQRQYKQIQTDAFTLPERHVTGVQNLLSWPSVRALLHKDQSEELSESYVIGLESKRGLLRLYGCSEGEDKNDLPLNDPRSNARGDPHSPTWGKPFRETLLSDRDHPNIAENWDIPLVMQQVRHGVLDSVPLSRWAEELLKSHCTPMRRKWANEMAKEIEAGADTSDTERLVQGLEKLVR
jgi:hypothetical protein